VVGLANGGRREGVRGGDVGARLEVGAVDLADELGPRQVEQVGIALDVSRVVAETLAAKLLLGEALSLQQHAPGTVEYDDPLVENALQLFDRVRHPCSSRLKSSRE